MNVERRSRTGEQDEEAPRELLMMVVGEAAIEGEIADSPPRPV